MRTYALLALLEREVAPELDAEEEDSGRGSSIWNEGVSSKMSLALL